MNKILLRTVKDLLTLRKSLTGSVGFVPTMGNLHQGHISLVQESMRENSHTLISIFVNPKQFAAGEDYGIYPRTLEADLQLLPEGSIIFAPQSAEEMYPANFKTTISVHDDLSKILCGKSRPEHFAGVTTVVYRLLRLAMPHKAYFGKKDYQQVMIIKRMAEDLLLESEIIACPIIRGLEGLALSSRNQYLSATEALAALILPRTLSQLAAELTGKGLQKSCEEFSMAKERILQDQRWEYLELLDAENLQAPSTATHHLILLGALRMKSARLIDNQEVSIN